MEAKQTRRSTIYRRSLSPHVTLTNPNVLKDEAKKSKSVGYVDTGGLDMSLHHTRLSISGAKPNQDALNLTHKTRGVILPSSSPEIVYTENQGPPAADLPTTYPTIVVDDKTNATSLSLLDNQQKFVDTSTKDVSHALNETNIGGKDETHASSSRSLNTGSRLSTVEKSEQKIGIVSSPVQSNILKIKTLEKTSSSASGNLSIPEDERKLTNNSYSKSSATTANLTSMPTLEHSTAVHKPSPVLEHLKLKDNNFDDNVSISK